MSMLSAQCDELRAMAESVGLEMPQAATLMMGAADTIDHLDAENDKLRNEVDNLMDFEHLTSVAVAYAGCDECGEYKQTMLRLFAENANLRERITTQKQTIQAYRDESREWREVAERAQAENAKLRELVRDYIDAPCTTCDCWQDEFRCWNYDGADCGLVARARDLGVEVD